MTISDYKLINLLAKNLKVVYPDSKGYACFNAWLPYPGVSSSTSLYNNVRMDTPSSSREKLHDICQKAAKKTVDEATFEQKWEAYCDAPLQAITSQAKERPECALVLGLLQDPKSSLTFFLGNGYEEANLQALQNRIQAFCQDLQDSYASDLRLVGKAADGPSRSARFYAKEKLGEMVRHARDGKLTGRPSVQYDAMELLKGIMSWMLDGAWGQGRAHGVVTGSSSEAPVMLEGSSVHGLVLDVYQFQSPDPSVASPWNLMRSSLEKGTIVITKDQVIEDGNGLDGQVAYGLGWNFEAGNADETPGETLTLDGTKVSLIRSVSSFPARPIYVDQNGEWQSSSPVSRRHAAIVPAVDAKGDVSWRLYDLGSSNGTIIRREQKRSVNWIGIGMGTRKDDARIDGIIPSRDRDIRALTRGDIICLGFNPADGQPPAVPCPNSLLLFVRQTD